MNIKKIYEQQLKDIRKKNSYLKDGKPLYIPLSNGFKRLRRYIAGFTPSSNIIVLAGSGVGKSRFVKKMFITDIVAYAKKNPHISVKIFFNSLEESPSELIGSILLERLYREHNIYMTHNELNLYQTTPMEDYKIQAIEECSEYIDELSKYLIIMQEPNNFAAFKFIRRWCRAHGTFYKGDKALDIPRTGDYNFRNTKYTSWKSDEEHSFHFLLTDRIGLLQPTNGMSKYDSVGEWSSKWCRSLLNLRYGFTTVNIVQAKSALEELDTTYSGDLITTKLVPNISSISINKSINTDATLIIALFCAARYGILKYCNYDITKWKSHLITLHIVKSRNTQSGLILPQFIDYSINDWLDAPKANETSKLKKVYARIAKIKKQEDERIKNQKDE